MLPPRTLAYGVFDCDFHFCSQKRIALRRLLHSELIDSGGVDLEFGSPLPDLESVNYIHLRDGVIVWL